VPRSLTVLDAHVIQCSFVHEDSNFPLLGVGESETKVK